ncbi:SpoIID/LytB domain-containing protein [Dethiothermospora halolimnae]|uniref:SpoIID/LytB domain-containing protein n=1 Tax=Dethiothermospora halolimnae TaxID=3114390 RepID=UPI003CCBE568
MSKKIISIVMIFVLAITLTFSSLSFATYKEEYINVGLTRPLKSNYQVKLSSNNSFKLINIDKDVEEIAKIDYSSIVVKLANNYIESDNNYYNTVKDNRFYYIELNENFNDYSDVLDYIKYLKKEGIEAYPAYYEGEYRIWIGQFDNKGDAIDTGEEYDNIINNEFHIIEANNYLIIEDGKGERIFAFNVDSNLILETEDDIIKVENTSYRDHIMFNIYKDKLVVINHVLIDHYLYGVVPKEMSPSWPMEALKAQSVAARNFMLLYIGRHSEKGYDLCDTSHCQVYGGFDLENIRSNEAVDLTRDKLLKYDDKLVYTYYHSSSGGYTESSENVWSNEVPYLKATDDQFSIGSPNDNWKIVLSKDEVKDKLKENSIDVGEIISISPTKVSETGRVIELEIVGSRGVERLEKNKMREVFGYNTLKSTLFETKTDGDVYVMSGNSSEPIKMNISNARILSGYQDKRPTRSFVRRDNNNIAVFNGEEINKMSINPDVYVFEGKGWGHGIGMSQWGAKKMAELGYTYEEILEYYYNGTKVE